MAVKTVNDYIDLLKNYLHDLIELKTRRFMGGETKLRLLDMKIRTFINRTYPDNEQRLEEYYELVRTPIIKGDFTYYEHTTTEAYRETIEKMMLFLESLLDEMKVYGLEFEKKIGPTKTQTTKEVSGSIPGGFLKFRFNKKKKES